MLAYFHLYHGLPGVPLAIAGALGAVTGRSLLSLGSRAFGDRFTPASWRANIETLATSPPSRPALAVPSLVLFALGLMPSNHVFVAAGLARAPLTPLLLVFVVARSVSYVLWMSAADVADQSLRDIFGWATWTGAPWPSRSRGSSSSCSPCASTGAGSCRPFHRIRSPHRGAPTGGVGRGA